MSLGSKHCSRGKETTDASASVVDPQHAVDLCSGAESLGLQLEAPECAERKRLPEGALPVTGPDICTTFLKVPSVVEPD